MNLGTLEISKAGKTTVAVRPIKEDWHPLNLKAIRLKPDSVNAYIDRGHAYDLKGDYDRVIADFNEVIRLDPNQAMAYIDRGNAYNRKGDYDKAIGDYSEAMRLNLDYAYICEEKRALAYSQKGDYEKAIADYKIGGQQRGAPAVHGRLQRARRVLFDLLSRPDEEEY